MTTKTSDGRMKPLRKYEAKSRGHYSVFVSEEPDSWGRGWDYYYITLEQRGRALEISRDDIPNLIEALQAIQQRPES